MSASTTTLGAQLLGQTQLLKPVAALAGWTFIMEAWMYATRLPAMSKYNVSLAADKNRVEMNTKIPIGIRQIADNYIHVHEQPTVFFAVALALAILGDNRASTLNLAWGYVGVRVVHSLFQALVNKVPIRFPIFLTSSILAGALTVRLAKLVF